MGSGHDHGGESRLLQRKALWTALILNASYFVVELIGGIAFNSLALLADAGHMLSDVAGLIIALVAQALIARPASDRYTFGLQRAEVLGALANAVTLLAVVGWIFFAGIRRLMDPEPVQGGALLVVAIVGLIVNAGSAVIILRARGRSLNMQGAFVHMASDALGSVAVVVAAIAVMGWGATWVDPVASLVIGVLIVGATWRLLRDTVHVLMEGTPRDLDIEGIQASMAGDGAISEVHHIHVWNLASDTPALSAHVVLNQGTSLHEAQTHGARIKESLHDRFGIDHATLELECHPCDDGSDASPEPTTNRQ